MNNWQYASRDGIAALLLVATVVLMIGCGRRLYLPIIEISAGAPGLKISDCYWKHEASRLLACSVNLQNRREEGGEVEAFLVRGQDYSGHETNLIILLGNQLRKEKTLELSIPVGTTMLKFSRATNKIETTRSSIVKIIDLEIKNHFLSCSFILPSSFLAKFIYRPD